MGYTARSIVRTHRVIAAFALVLLAWTASGAALEMHHDECCPQPASQAAECRACYLIKIGRTLLTESPAALELTLEAVHITPIDSIEAPQPARPRAPAAPRAPPSA